MTIAVIADRGYVGTAIVLSAAHAPTVMAVIGKTNSSASIADALVITRKNVRLTNGGNSNGRRNRKTTINGVRLTGRAEDDENDAVDSR